jgi:hypothetical protein
MVERPKNEVSVQASAGEPRPARKPYTTPALKRLGSVRELTLGAPTGCQTEAKLFRMM